MRSCDMIRPPTMVRPTDRSKTVARMVELRAVQPGFPLYGAVVLQDEQLDAHEQNGG